MKSCAIEEQVLDKEICSNLGSNRYGEDVKVADEYAYERESVPVISEAKVRLLENPVSRELNLHFSPGYSEEVSLMVLDIQGRVLLQANATQHGVHRLLLPALASGTYFLRLSSLKEGSVCLKFIKQ